MATAEKHPKGLMILFFTEMWERFSYYGMRGLFVLYLTAKVSEGGFGWSNIKALALYGTYTMMVYLASIPGGILADRFIGAKKSVVVGGTLLVFGHSILAINGLFAFYTAITLIVMGVGALKANISTMVGGLYKEGDIRRDKGFTIFYMGINLGALLSSIIVGWIGQSISWHLGFGLAGIGMLAGQITFLFGLKHLKGIGDKPIKKIDNEIPQVKINEKIQAVINNPISLGITAITLFLGIKLILDNSILNGILLLIASGFIGNAINIHRNLTKIEKDRVTVLLISFLIVIMFFAAFEQAGGSMNLFAKEDVRLPSIFGLDIVASQLQALNPLFIILLGIPIANFWKNRRIRNKEESTIFKMGVGNIILGLGFVLLIGAAIEADYVGSASVMWLFGAYALHTIGELCLSPTALSFITKLAPKKYASSMMGIFFAMTGLGNKIAGELGIVTEKLGEKQSFGFIGMFSILSGLILALFTRKLKKLSHGAEEVHLKKEKE